MIKQTPAQMYLASNRKVELTRAGQCFSVVDCNQTALSTNAALGNLITFKYHILVPNQKVIRSLQAKKVTYSIALFGGYQLADNELINVGQVKEILSELDVEVEFFNPFDSNISFLEIGLATESILAKNHTLSFVFDQQNKLNTVVENESLKAFIGQFEGRSEGEYTQKNAKNGIFVYVLQGAFEFENRLLETGDALSMIPQGKVEWEALSQNAILVLLELPTL